MRELVSKRHCDNRGSEAIRVLYCFAVRLGIVPASGGRLPPQVIHLTIMGSQVLGIRLLKVPRRFAASMMECG